MLFRSLTNGNFSAKDTKTAKSLISKEGITVDNLDSAGIITTSGNLNITGDFKNKAQVLTNKELNINGRLENSGNIQATDKISILENVLNSGEILTNSSFTSKDVKTTNKLVAKEDIRKIGRAHI